MPAVLLWGPHDPIFSDRYLDDLVRRLPHAHVHRFSDAGHLIAEDVDWTAPVLSWLGALPAEGSGTSGITSPSASADEPATPFVPLWAALDARADDAAPAVLDMTTQGADGRPFTASWRALDRQVRRVAAGLHGIGVRRGDRVSLLVEPGPTLTALVYACLRIGAVVVVADAGLGVRGLTRAQRGAWPRFVVAQRKGLAAARALGWPGVRVSAEPLAPSVRRALGVHPDSQ